MHDIQMRQRRSSKETEHVLYVEKKCNLGSHITTILRNDDLQGLFWTNGKDRKSYLVVMFSILAVFEAGWSDSRSVPHAAARFWHLRQANKTEIKMLSLVRMLRQVREVQQEVPLGVPSGAISKHPHNPMESAHSGRDSLQEPGLSSSEAGDLR